VPRRQPTPKRILIKRLPQRYHPIIQRLTALAHLRRPGSAEAGTASTIIIIEHSPEDLIPPADRMVLLCGGE
jgi:hypothetical protein